MTLAKQYADEHISVVHEYGPCDRYPGLEKHRVTVVPNGLRGIYSKQPLAASRKTRTFRGEVAHHDATRFFEDNVHAHKMRLPW